MTYILEICTMTWYQKNWYQLLACLACNLVLNYSEFWYIIWALNNHVGVGQSCEHYFFMCHICDGIQCRLVLTVSVPYLYLVNNILCSTVSSVL